MQTRSARDDDDVKVMLIRTAFRHLSADLWAEGDGRRFGWVWGELDAIEGALDALTLDELRRRLRFLYKWLAAAKGRRRGRTSDWGALPVGTENTGTAHANENRHRHRQGADMAILVEVPKESSGVQRGEHAARIVAISEQQSKFDAAKRAVKITFEITQGKSKGARLSRYFSLSLSSQSALGILWRRLMGEPTTERVDLEQLIGQECAVMVTHKDGQDGPYAIIQDVFAPERG